MDTEHQKISRLESLEAICLFIAPILVFIPLYALGLLDILPMVYYAIYSVYIAGSYFIIKHNRREWSEIGITRSNLSDSLLISIGFIAAFIITQTISSELHLSTELTTVLVVEQLVFNFAFSGLGQEILFRGVLLFSLARWKGWELGVVISSILFGLVHILKGVHYVIATILIGLMYAFITYRTKNIVGPIVAHGLNNFILGFILVV